MDQDDTEWIQRLLSPLRMGTSEVFVQNVMRKVRSYDPQPEWVRWPVFARWAMPALALSAMSFMAAMAYTVRPAQVSTDVLLMTGRDPTTPAEWISNPPTEDQILALVVKP